MKPFEIALFKHFIDSKGMATVWINMYRKNHLKKNPASIEEFLKTCDVRDACVNAFYFHPNSNYGFDYWTQMQEWWLVFLESNRNDYIEAEWYKMHGVTKILRYNWDAAKHWKMENRYMTALRMGIDPALVGDFSLAHCEDTPPTKLSEELLREKTKKEYLDATTKKEKPEENGIVNNNSVDDDFSVVEVVMNKNSGRRKLKDNEISINLRNEQGRITFNQKISEEIKKRGNYKYIRLLKNKHGDVALRLNNENGIVICIGSRNNSKSNVNVTSIALTKKLVEVMGISEEIKANGDYMIVDCKEIASGDGFVTYLVTKK